MWFLYSKVLWIGSSQYETYGKSWIWQLNTKIKGDQVIFFFLNSVKDLKVWTNLCVRLPVMYFGWTPVGEKLNLAEEKFAVTIFF